MTYLQKTSFTRRGALRVTVTLRGGMARIRSHSSHFCPRCILRSKNLSRSRKSGFLAALAEIKGADSELPFLLMELCRNDFSFHRERYWCYFAYKSIISDSTGSYGCPRKESLPYPGEDLKSPAPFAFRLELAHHLFEGLDLRFERGDLVL